jgi:ABC-type glutathione transport system ATPase component
MTSSHSPKPILEAHSLSKTFRSRDGSETVALDQVSLILYPGEVAALIGESGSGKTTLGRAILRLLKLDQGQILFDQVDLLSLKKSELRKARRSFQMIFQNQQANLHPKMSVAQMLDESLELHQPHLSLTEREERANELLTQVGLTSHHQQYLASLSGGEQRRVGLARILATSPKLIVADEPTSGLDAAIKLQIIDLLKSLKG